MLVKDIDMLRICVFTTNLKYYHKNQNNKGSTLPHRSLAFYNEIYTLAFLLCLEVLLELTQKQTPPCSKFTCLTCKNKKSN